ncbi:MAG: glutamine-hydrolyzing GMP synthase [Defluviitaleaceae bacterium]|nr:glutamine-hydrolyzing GMP synthase [Defluviitaleaceae bacterium]MCL2239347.1 glutamine-hydrolyzing GMP synthase [Defluviitaleaceae bacterium]
MKNVADFIAKTTRELQAQIGDKKAICGLSGGVDSSVAAALVHKAVPGCLTCVYVDTGLMRQNECREVEEMFTGQFKIPFIRVDAVDEFLLKLTGIIDPEAKRKIIGETFVRVFEREAKKRGDAECLVQGTILPDIEESAAKTWVKSHHNVGGMPETMTFTELVEPLRTLCKDEVRQVGLELGMTNFMVFRQPFPGPGLAVRCLGEITAEKLDILRRADDIVTGALDELDIWQYFAILTGLRSVGIKNGKRVYGHVIAIRAVSSVNARTAEWFKIPYDILSRLSKRLTEEIPEVCRVVYDITDKPCGTIEWE